MQLENGDYDAKVAGGASVYESNNGNLVACFLVDLGEVDKKYFCSLTQKQGDVVNERTVKELKEIYPEWDGNPAWLSEGDNINGESVVVRIVNETNPNDGKTYANVKGMYHPDHVPGEMTSEMPAGMDKKTLTAKYGAKFRAVTGAVAGAGTGKPAPRKRAEPKSETTDDLTF